jgi:hypothetical protein
MTSSAKLMEYRVITNVALCDQDGGFCDCKQHNTIHLVKFCGVCDECKKNDFENCQHFQRFEETYTAVPNCETCERTHCHKESNTIFRCEAGAKTVKQKEIPKSDKLTDPEARMLSDLKDRDDGLPMSGTAFYLHPEDGEFYDDEEILRDEL